MTSPNAPLLQRMNTLKEAVAPDLLTEPQTNALEQIHDHRSEEEPYINLHGPSGAGKTFLCWVLQQDSEWQYCQAFPDDVQSPTVIYDHGNPGQSATRRLRRHSIIKGLATVVYVTNKPAEEVYPRVELDPAESHYEKVAENWADHDIDPANAPTYNS